MKTRTYGDTGIELSAIGFGGIVVKGTSANNAERIVADAIDRGVNYFDVAPTYGDAEERLGPALQPYRQNVFLACKTTERLAPNAEQELTQSLKRLKTDNFDLYQFHGISNMDDVEQITGPGGALETILKAREKGLIQHIGFSAHNEDAALAIMERFDFDSVLFPFNCVCWHSGNFGPRVLQAAEQKNVARLALKTLAHRPWYPGEERLWPKCWYKPIDTLEDAIQALRFTLSLPVTAAVCPSHQELLRLACEAVEKFEPMSEKEARQFASNLGDQPVFSSE